MAISTGSKALDFALGIGAYAPAPSVSSTTEQGSDGYISRHGRSRDILDENVPKSAEAYAPIVKQLSDKYGLPYEHMMALIQTESAFNPGATSNKNARGLMQLIPETAARYGVKNSYDPVQNLEGGFKFYSDLYNRFGRLDLADAAYNSGPNRASLRAGRIPNIKETQDYVSRIANLEGKYAGHEVGQTPTQPAAPQSASPIQPAPQGLRPVWLSNSKQINVPEDMTDVQVHENLKKTDNPDYVGAVPTRQTTLGGKSMFVPYNMQDDEATHHLVNQGLMEDPSAGPRWWGNVVSGVERLVGSTLKGIGQDKEAEDWQKKAEAGEYRVYPSEVEAARKEGLPEYALAKIQQNLLYPGATMLGEFLPATVGGKGALATTAKVASMYPSARGQILQRGEEEGKPVDPTTATIAALPLAAVETLGLPIKGVPGLSAASKADRIKKLVSEGAIDEAKKLVGSRTGDIVKNYAAGVGKNVAAMGAMEGIQKAAMGETPYPTSWEELEQIVEPALWFAAPHAVHAGITGKTARSEALEEAKGQIGEETKARAYAESQTEEAPTAPVGEPSVTRPQTEIRTELQAIGEAYGKHVANATERGETPLGPEEFARQYAAQDTEVSEKTPETQTPARGQPAGQVDIGAWAQEFVKPNSMLYKRHFKNLDFNDTAAVRRALTDHASKGAVDRIKLKEFMQRHGLTFETAAEAPGAAAPSEETIKPSPFERKKPQETQPSAEQIPETSPTDGSGGAQPDFRKEGRDQTVSGAGMEPSGQGEQAPEVSVEGKKEAPLGKVKVPPRQKGIKQVKRKEVKVLDEDEEIVGVEYLSDEAKKLLEMTPKDVAKLSEKEKISYYQFNGLSNSEIGAKLRISKKKVLEKLKEYGLHDTEVEVDRPISKERKKAIEADEEERAKYRATSSPIEGETPRERLNNLYVKAFGDVDYSYMDGVASKESNKHKIEVAPDTISVESKNQQHMDGVKKFWSNRHDEIQLSTPSGHSIGIDLDKGIVTFRVKNKPEKSISYYRDYNKIESPDLLTVKPLNAIGESGPIPKTLGEKIYSAVMAGPKDGVHKLLQDLGIHEIGEALKAEHDIKNRTQEALDVPAKKPKEAKKKAQKEAQEKPAEDVEDLEDSKDDEYFKNYAETNITSDFDFDDVEIYELPDFFFYEPSKGEVAKNAHTPESLTENIADTYGNRKPAVNITTRDKAQVDAKTKAFYDPKTKKVHLVADNIDKSDNIHGLLRHEIGVHARRLGKSDAEFQGILNHLQGMRDKGVKSVREAYAKVPTDTRSGAIHEEALGYLVEHHPQLPIVRRFMSWLRRMAHNLTGHAGWLKAEDLAHMADLVLKKELKEGEVGRPERRGVTSERLESRRAEGNAPHEDVEMVRRAGITKHEPQQTIKEASKGILDKVKSALSRSQMIDTNDPITRAVQQLDKVDKNIGRLRADVVAAQANQAVGLVAHALENGIPIINKSGAMMVRASSSNLKNIAELAKKAEKNGEELLSFALRVEIGEHRLKEHEVDLRDIARLDREITELKAAIKYHDKLGHQAEYKKAVANLNDKETAKKMLLKGRNIDPETLEGREKLVTQEHIDQKNKILRDHSWVKPLMDKTYEAMRGLVDFQEQAGMIDHITAEKWKSAPYVPLYKSLTDLETDPIFGKQRGKTAESLSEVKQIMGFKHSVNMMENLHKHYFGMMLPAIFNHVRRTTMDQVRHIDALEKMADDPNLKYKDAYRKATSEIEKPKAMDNTVKVMENGEEKHYVIDDPDLLHTLAFVRPELHDFVQNFSRKFTEMVRFGALKNPGFWGKQLFLEPLTANMYTGMNTIVHPGQAVYNLLKIATGTSKESKTLERHGLDVGLHDYSHKMAMSYKDLSGRTAYHDLVGRGSKFRKLVKTWDNIHNSVDEAVRISIFKAALKEGKKEGLSGQLLEDYAADKARTFVNFSAIGKSQFIHNYRATIAFSSAALNGLDAIMRNATGYGLNAKEAAKVRKIFRRRAMVTTAAALGYSLAQAAYNPDYAANGDTQDQLGSILVPVAEGRDLKLPVNWDVGTLFFTLPQIFVRTMMLNAVNKAHMTPSQATTEALKALRENVLPPVHFAEWSNPLIETITNTSFRTLDKIDTPGAQRLEPEARGRFTSPIGQFISSTLSDIGVPLSPKAADNLGRGYFANMYDIANSLADVLSDKNKGMAKDWTESFMGKTTGAGKFFTNPYKVPGANPIYEAADRAAVANSTYNDYVKNREDEALNKFKSDPVKMKYRSAEPSLRHIVNTLNNIDKNIKQISEDKSMSYADRQEAIKKRIEDKRRVITTGNKRVVELLGEDAP